MVILDEISSTLMSFKHGDLILLDEESTGETVLNSGWCSGMVESSGAKGHFRAEAVYVLPSLNRPPDDILVSWKLQMILRFEY